MTETLIGIESKNTVEQFIDAVEILTQEIQDLYLRRMPSNYRMEWWKDSTSVLQIIWNSIAALPVEQRTKTIHVITNDTLVENPIISTWVKRSFRKNASSSERTENAYRNTSNLSSHSGYILGVFNW